MKNNPAKFSRSLDSITVIDYYVAHMPERRQRGFIDQMRNGSDIRLLGTRPGSRANRTAATAGNILFPFSWRAATESIHYERNNFLSTNDRLEERKFRRGFMAATLLADTATNLVIVEAFAQNELIPGLVTGIALKLGTYAVARLGFTPFSR